MFAALFLAMAPVPAVSSPASPAAATVDGLKQEPSVQLAILIGEERTQVDAIVELSARDSDVIESFGRAEIGDHACTFLDEVYFQDLPLCYWLPVAFITAEPRQQVTVTPQSLRVRFTFAVRSSELLTRYDTISFRLGEDGPSRLKLAGLIRAPYWVAGADPIPDSLQNQKLAYDLARQPGKPLEVRLRVSKSIPRPNFDPLERRSVLGGTLAKIYAKARGLLEIFAKGGLGGAGLLVPILMAWALLRRLQGPLAQERSARRAARGVLGLAILSVGAIAINHGDGALALLFPRATSRLSDALQSSWDFSVTPSFALARWTVRISGVAIMTSLMAFILYLVQRLIVRLKVPLRLPWLWVPFLTFLTLALLASVLAAFQLYEGGPGERIPVEAYLLATMAVTIPAIAWTLANLIGAAGLARWATVATTFGLALALLPWRGLPQLASTGTASAELFAVYLLIHIQSLAQAAVLIPLVWLLGLLHRRPVLNSRLHMGHLTGAAIFAAALMPRANGWAGLAAGLIAILVVWPKVALCGAHAARLKRQSLPLILPALSKWVERLEQAAALKAVSRRVLLDTKLSSGELTPSAWARRRQALEAARDRAIDAIHLPNGLNARDLVLGTSLERDPWRSALRAVAYGAPLVLILTLLRPVPAEAFRATPQPLLAWLSNVISPAAKMAAAIFLFGYFFDRLRGGTGLHKALALGTAFCLAEAVLWLPRLDEPTVVAGMVWTFSQHFLLLIPIGVLAFDFGRMGQVEGHGFDWRRFNWFGDPKLLSTGIAAILAALGPTVATLFSGSFASAVKDVMTVVAPSLAGTQ